MLNPQSPIVAFVEVCGTDNSDSRYSPGMKHKLSFLLFAITWLCSTSIRAGDKAAIDRLRTANPGTEQSTTVQAASASEGVSFAPLDRWKAAVLTGDKAAIKSFYVSDPTAFAQTPQGKIADAATEESDFWSKLSPLVLQKSCRKFSWRSHHNQALTPLRCASS